MPADAETIDFKTLKRNLMGSDQASPINCAVALYGDKSVGLLVDKAKSAKAMTVVLRKQGGGHFFWGTAYIDEFPGKLCLTLNRAPSGLAQQVRLALRGSGFGRVEVVLSADADTDTDTTTT